MGCAKGYSNSLPCCRLQRAAWAHGGPCGMHHSCGVLLPQRLRTCNASEQGACTLLPSSRMRASQDVQRVWRWGCSHSMGLSMSIHHIGSHQCSEASWLYAAVASEHPCWLSEPADATVSGIDWPQQMISWPINDYIQLQYGRTASSQSRNAVVESGATAVFTLLR
jgi:hypothetical protein